MMPGNDRFRVWRRAAGNITTHWLLVDESTFFNSSKKALFQFLLHFFTHTDADTDGTHTARTARF
jgi:hypothetical protein